MKRVGRKVRIGEEQLSIPQWSLMVGSSSVLRRCPGYIPSTAMNTDGWEQLSMAALCSGGAPGAFPAQQSSSYQGGSCPALELLCREPRVCQGHFPQKFLPSTLGTVQKVSPLVLGAVPI